MSFQDKIRIEIRSGFQEKRGCSLQICFDFFEIKINFWGMLEIFRIDWNCCQTTDFRFEIVENILCCLLGEDILENEK